MVSHDLRDFTPHEKFSGAVGIVSCAHLVARRDGFGGGWRLRLTAGERFGMIKLGSRTEVCLVENAAWEVVAAVGDQVHAGVTVLARLRAAGRT